MAKPLPDIRCRVKELRMVRVSELRPHPLNPAVHGKEQRAVVKHLLKDVGYADALKAYEESDGSLCLYDGHLRAELTPGQEVPVIVTDLTPDEALTMLRAFDPVAAMRGMDEEALQSLIAAVNDDVLEALLATVEPAATGSAQPEEDPWKTLTFRVPAGAVPVIEQQVERICELCGYDRKTRGLCLERWAVLSSTASDEELAGE